MPPDPKPPQPPQQDKPPGLVTRLVFMQFIACACYTTMLTVISLVSSRDIQLANGGLTVTMLFVTVLAGTVASIVRDIEKRRAQPHQSQAEQPQDGERQSG